jgi:hypothetical protein
MGVLKITRRLSHLQHRDLAEEGALGQEAQPVPALRQIDIVYL